MAVEFGVLEANGSHREIGRQVGEGARPLIERSLAAYEAEFESCGGMSLATAEALTAPLLAAAERSLPQYVDELRGMAEGAGVPFARLFLLNCGEELTCSPSLEAGRCTSLALAGRGRTILAHNEDWEERDIENQLLVRMALPDGARILTMTTAGSLAMTGLNSHGLAFAANTVYAREGPPGGLRGGVPNAFVCRWMLEARTRDEATARALSPGRARGSNHLCAQAGGTVWDVETSGERAAVVEARPGVGATADGATVGPAADGAAAAGTTTARATAAGTTTARATAAPADVPGSDWAWLAHTNHYIAQEMLEVEASTSLGSRRRYGRACALSTQGLRQGVDPVGLAASVLRDHENAPTSICGHGGEGPDAPSPTTASMIWELEERRMHVCAGPPCTNPYRVVSLD